eukprot:COSAG02_NODE_9895_length_2081_cov_1.313320_1_plen_85_part_00
MAEATFSSNHVCACQLSKVYKQVTRLCNGHPMREQLLCNARTVALNDELCRYATLDRPPYVRIVTLSTFATLTSATDRGNTGNR